MLTLDMGNYKEAWELLNLYQIYAYPLYYQSVKELFRLSSIIDYFDILPTALQEELLYLIGSNERLLQLALLDNPLNKTSPLISINNLIAKYPAIFLYPL